jgi:hypothetical protein
MFILKICDKCSYRYSMENFFFLSFPEAGSMFDGTVPVYDFMPCSETSNTGTEQKTKNVLAPEQVLA